MRNNTATMAGHPSFVRAGSIRPGAHVRWENGTIHQVRRIDRPTTTMVAIVDEDFDTMLVPCASSVLVYPDAA